MESSDLHICIVFIYLLNLSIFCCRKQLSLPHPLSLFRAFFLLPSRTYLCVSVFFFPRKGKERKKNCRALSFFFVQWPGNEREYSRLSARACVSFVSTLGILGRGSGRRLGERASCRVVCGGARARSTRQQRHRIGVTPSFLRRASLVVFFFCCVCVSFCTVPSAPLVSHRGAKRSHHRVSLPSPL